MPYIIAKHWRGAANTRRPLISGILGPAVSYLPFFLELKDANPSSVPRPVSRAPRPRESWGRAARQPENVLGFAKHWKLSHLTFSAITGFLQMRKLRHRSEM